MWTDSGKVFMCRDRFIAENHPKITAKIPQHSELLCNDISFHFAGADSFTFLKSVANEKIFRKGTDISRVNAGL